MDHLHELILALALVFAPGDDLNLYKDNRFETHGVGNLMLIAVALEMCGPDESWHGCTFGTGVDWMRFQIRNGILNSPRLFELDRFPDRETTQNVVADVSDYYCWLSEVCDWYPNSHIDGDHNLDLVCVAFKKIHHVYYVWDTLGRAHGAGCGLASRRRALGTLQHLLSRRDFAFGRMPNPYPLGTVRRN